MSNNYNKSNAEIDRLGNRIRNNAINDNNELSDLQAYRVAHNNTLKEVFHKICKHINRGKTNANVKNTKITTYRIKRLESIIKKLHRFPDSRLCRMWDIGGCRIILESNNQVYKMVNFIKGNFIIKREKDYIKNPSEDGYKSYHIYVQIPESKFVIEIQIRNRESHDWATLVEISDLVFDSGLKEYGKNKELQKFHLLLSKYPKVSYEETVTISNIIGKYNYVEKLSGIFSKNYLDVKKQFLDLPSKSRNTYFLLETSKNKPPLIKSYRNFAEAEENHFIRYSKNPNANLLLTHLPNPSYDHLSIAYSNYILTMHNFISNSASVFETLSLQAMEKKKYLKFLKYFNLYNKNIFFRYSTAIEEVNFTNNLYANSSIQNKKKLKSEITQWNSDIKSKLNTWSKKAERFRKQYQLHLPEKWMQQKIITSISNRLAKKYKRKIEKLVRKIEKQNQLNQKTTKS